MQSGVHGVTGSTIRTIDVRPNGRPARETTPRLSHSLTISRNDMPAVRRARTSRITACSFSSGTKCRRSGPTTYPYGNVPHGSPRRRLAASAAFVRSLCTFRFSKTCRRSFSSLSTSSNKVGTNAASAFAAASSSSTRPKRIRSPLASTAAASALASSAVHALDALPRHLPPSSLYLRYQRPDVL